MGILLTNGDSFTQGDELPGSRRLNEKGRPMAPIHHHLTFSHKLAEHLDRDYVNLGANGASNQKILRRGTTFLQKTSKQVDYMVIIWSSWGRTEIVSMDHRPTDEQVWIFQECNMNQLIPDHYQGRLRFGLRGWNEHWADEKKIQHEQACINWFKHAYTMATPVLHHLNYMTIMQDLCDAKGIKLIQGIIHWSLWENVKAVLMEEDVLPFATKEIKHYIKYLRPECKLGFGDGRDMTSIAESRPDCFIYPLGHPCENTHTHYAKMLYEIFTNMTPGAR
jgi:hypothetical protein